MMRNKRLRAVLSLCSVLLLAGCLTTNTSAPAPVTHYGLHGGAGSAGMHSVASGDTIGNLAKRYDLSYQDIIAVNGLSPPYALHTGQRLALPPPRTYKVRPGDTAASVARLFNVSPSQMVRLNEIKSPYVLREGQTLRLPPAIRKAPVEEPQPSRQIAQTSLSSSPGYNPPPATETSARPDRVEKVEKEVLDAPLPPPAVPSSVPVASSPAPQPGTQPSASVAVSETISPPLPPRAGNKFIWPVNGSLVSGYGPKKDGRHNDGINIKAPRGTAVKAAENGVIVYAADELQGYGNLILIRHADRWLSAYAHLDGFSVGRGETVKQGQMIGKVGSSGGVDSPQLHFEIRRGTEALNPEPYLARQGS